MFVLLCVCARISRCYCLAFDVVWGHNFTLMWYFAAQIHYNGNDGSALIFVCWMYGTGAVLALNQQRVRLYCCVCLNLKMLVMFDIVWGRNTTLTHALFCCPNILQWWWRLCVVLRLLNVWMKWVSFWLWTNRPYVCIAVSGRLNLNMLLLSFDPVCYEVVILSACDILLSN